MLGAVVKLLLFAVIVNLNFWRFCSGGSPDGNGEKLQKIIHPGGWCCSVVPWMIRCKVDEKSYLERQVGIRQKRVVNHTILGFRSGGYLRGASAVHGAATKRAAAIGKPRRAGSLANGRCRLAVARPDERRPRSPRTFVALSVFLPRGSHKPPPLFPRCGNTHGRERGNRGLCTAGIPQTLPGRGAESAALPYRHFICA